MTTAEEKTYWRNCRWNAPKDSPPWELRHTGNSGYSAFALRNFKRGDQILIEKPLVCVQGHHPFGDVQRDEIQKNVSRLNKVDKTALQVKRS